MDAMRMLVNDGVIHSIRSNNGEQYLVNCAYATSTAPSHLWTQPSAPYHAPSKA